MPSIKVATARYPCHASPRRLLWHGRVMSVMANTETRRRRGATPIAGRDKKAAGAARPAPKRAAARRGSGAQATVARPTAKRADRFHAVWSSGQLAALLCALACAGAVTYLLTAGSLQIRQIDLAGAALTSSDAITVALGVSGHNIFTVEPQVAAARLAAARTNPGRQLAWPSTPIAFSFRGRCSATP